jgi:uncharacterized OB-fold protein
MAAETIDEVLRAPLVIEYPFRRTTGPVIGAFFTAVREGRLLGIKAANGSVICPPQEYDPVTAEPLTELVPVGDTGTVESWTWVTESDDGQPFDRPFAWVLVRLDGADTPMMHALDVAGPNEVSVGQRVRVVWAEERTGAITDFHFAPDTDDESEASS